MTSPIIHPDVTSELLGRSIFEANIATIRAGKVSPIVGDANWQKTQSYGQYHNYCRSTVHDDVRPHYGYDKAPVGKTPVPVVADAKLSKRAQKRARYAELSAFNELAWQPRHAV